MSYKALALRVIFLPRRSGSMSAQGFEVLVADSLSFVSYGSTIVFAYKIFGLQPGLTDGLVFNSCVKDLQSQPDLWLDECPYLNPRSSSPLPKGLRVELVSATDEASAPAMTWALAA